MYYIMSDIHGCYRTMMKALEHWNKDKEHLVIIGDLIDRGPDSYKVVSHLMKLKRKYDNVTVLMGNHEEMLLSWLVDTPHELLGHYYNPMHRETLMSFMGEKRYARATRKQRGSHMLYKHKDELKFMMSLPRFFETDNMIFVHAGINLDDENWKTDEFAMLWTRNEFYHSPIKSPKRVFFGHTPTKMIRDKNVNDIWISPDETKVGIDGGLVFGGQLNALKVNSKGEITDVLRFKKCD